MNFFQAWVLTIGIETTIMFFLFRNRYSPDFIARNSILASTITLPFVWFAFTQLGLAWGLQTTLSELFAIGAETGIYVLLFQGMKTKDAFFASLICNTSSFLAGLLFTLMA